MKLFRRPSLKKYNTFHLDITCEEMVILENERDYEELPHRFSLNDRPFLVLGEGSNILFTQDFKGLIIHSSLKEMTVIREDEQYAWLRIGSGLNWHECVRKSIQMGYQGLENLSLIPGQVGAAPVQNIGAYGVELDQFVHEVEVIDLIDRRVRKLSARDCEFGYRTSLFKTSGKNRYLVKAVVLRLNRVPVFHTEYERIRETLEQMNATEVTPALISEAVIRIRQNKLPDPQHLGNAGSFFKNPVIDRIDYEGLKAEFPDIRGFETKDRMFKVPAAWLIEQCGWKGYRKGDVGSYEKQPLVLVNHGNATGTEILKLAEKIRESVMDRFGLILEPEVNIL